MFVDESLPGADGDAVKTVRDAVHGDITIDGALMPLIDTRAMQRLRGIRQLGTSHLVYPSANHTRFDHSLGAAWMTTRLVERLRVAGHAIDADQERLAIAAALLHDVTHVPFGHTFEDERRLFARHDEDADRLGHFLDGTDLAGPIARLGFPHELKAALLGSDHDAGSSRSRTTSASSAKSTASAGGTGPDFGASSAKSLPSAVDPLRQPFIGELVRGAIGADLLDYLKRDALFTGLSLAYDDRLLHYFGIEAGRLVVRLYKRGGFRRDALSELVHLLQIRYTLTERVYYHHAKVVSGAMISRALELPLRAGAIAQRDLYDLRDDGLLYRLRLLAGSVDGLADVLDDLESRRLYKRVYMLTAEGFGRTGLNASERRALATSYHDDIANRAKAEAMLAAELGIPESHVIVYCPSPKMALKEADVPVEVEPGRIVPLSSLCHPDVTALSQKHAGLWRMLVCLRRDHESKFEKAGTICEKLFGHPDTLAVYRQSM